MIATNKFINLLLVAMLILISNCQFKKNDPNEFSDEEIQEVLRNSKQQQSENQSSFFLKNEIVIKYEPLPELQNYTAVIKWPSRLKNVEILHDDSIIMAIDSRNNQFTTTYKAGTEKKITIRSKNSQGHIITEHDILLKLPKDIYLKSIELMNDTIIKANRIVLEKEALIITNGYNLTVDADLLGMQNNIFITRRLSATKIKNSDPDRVTNGTILINARKIVGTLEIKMLGLDGASGSDGSEESKGRILLKDRYQKPHNGANAIPGSSKPFDLALCEKLEREKIYALEEQMRSSSDENTRSNSMNAKSIICNYPIHPSHTESVRPRAEKLYMENLMNSLTNHTLSVVFDPKNDPDLKKTKADYEGKCLNPGTPATDGEDVADGAPGKDGIDGGSTGHLSIITEDYSEAQVRIYQKPGQPGLGGKGEPFIEGGNGGIGWTDPEYICPLLPPGKKGKDGLAGKDGADGKPGTYGEVIIPSGSDASLHFRIIRD